MRKTLLWLASQFLQISLVFLFAAGRPCYHILASAGIHTIARLTVVILCCCSLRYFCCWCPLVAGAPAVVGFLLLLLAGFPSVAGFPAVVEFLLLLAVLVLLASLLLLAILPSIPSLLFLLMSPADWTAKQLSLRYGLHS
jgi:hypothetical protein